ncbi:hypothetical protein [Acinetobacter sp.]|uniref:hypothetical protein n=1 Tax=Acinetobacter sp. TaxID=472 RepID=UPI003753325F
MSKNETKKSSSTAKIEIDGGLLAKTILKVAVLYQGNLEQFATAAQIALILKVSRLYSEIPDEDVGNFMVQSAVPCVFRSSKAYFKITSLLEKSK